MPQAVMNLKIIRVKRASKYSLSALEPVQWYFEQK